MINKINISNKKGFTLVEVIIVIVVAAILGALLVNFMGPNLIGSSTSGVHAYDHYELIGIMEKINVDYDNLMNAGDTNSLVTLQSRIAAGNYGNYTAVTTFIIFNSSNVEETATSSNTLKVTISKNYQTATVLFTN